MVCDDVVSAEITFHAPISFCLYSAIRILFCSNFPLYVTSIRIITQKRHVELFFQIAVFLSTCFVAVTYYYQKSVPTLRESPDVQKRVDERIKQN